MKKQLLLYGLLPLIFIFGFSLNGKAQLLLEENFAYPVGDLLTAHGWTAHSGAATNPITTTIASISYTGYLSSGIGNEVTLGPTGEDDHKGFTAQSAGSLYTSFLVNVIGTASTGDYFFHLADDAMATSSYKGRVFVKSDGGSNIAFGISFGGNVSTATFTPFSYALNTTYLIVVKYTFIATGTGDDVVDLFINPTLGGTEPTSAVTVTNSTAASDPANLGNVSLRQGTASNSVNIKLDGIRVGQTWADVAGGAPTVSINVASPSAGEQWRQGSTHNIIWTATGTNTNVKIEFTDNASAGTPTWTTLNPSIAASAGTWTWNVPANQATSADCKIRITDIPVTATGLSGTFSIVPPPALIGTIAALRNTPANTVVTFSGQGVLTFQQAFRHQKYIQDPTAAILIDDNGGKITTVYNLGDALTNITGTVAVFNGMTQFTPESDPGAAASTGNVIVPEVVSLAQLYANWENYEAELIRIPNVNFDNPSGNFVNGTLYPITDSVGTTANFRTTFYDVDYIGTAVPNFTEDLVVIPNSRIDGDQITSRNKADFYYNSSNNIVVTEIMYNPPHNTVQNLKFIEIYNKGTNAVNMKSWHFSSGPTYSFHAGYLAPASYVAIAEDSVAFHQMFNKTANQWASGTTLNVLGDLVKLSDAVGTVKDSVNYLPTAPWPVQANGGGRSLSLCDPNSNSSLVINWSASTEYAGKNTSNDSIFATPLAGCFHPATVANFIGTPTTLYVGGHVQFTDQSTNTPTAWEWTFPGGTPAVSTTQNPLIQYNTFGIYSVTLKATNAYGNNTLTKTDYINVGHEGITLLPSSSFSVYPNPTSGKLCIANPEKVNVTVSILSPVGQTLKVIESADDIIRTDLTGFAAGIYLVKLQNQTGLTEKIMKLIVK